MLPSEYKKIANSKSMMIVPQVRLKPPIRNALFPVAVMIAGMSEPRIVSLRETTEFSEKKIDSVARVTMNGGRLIRVTSRPLIAPIACRGSGR